RDAHGHAVDGDALVAHQLARLVTSRSEAHPIDDVVEPAFQHLQQVRAGRARTARGLDVVVAELALQHAVHAAQLQLFAQLRAVVGQAAAAFAFDATRRHFQLALGLERYHAALQQQVRAFATRQLALRT